MTNNLKALTIHDVIDDLCRQARAIAPRHSEIVLESGVWLEDEFQPKGPRQIEAHRLVSAALNLNGATS